MAVFAQEKGRLGREMGFLSENRVFWGVRLTVSFNKDVSSWRQLTSLFNEDVSLFNKDVSSWRQLTSLFNEDVSLLNKDVSLLNKDVSLLNKDVSLLNKDVSLLNKDVSLLNKDVSSWRQLTSLFNEDVSLLNKDVSSWRQLTSLLNEDVSLLNKDVLSEAVEGRWGGLFCPAREWTSMGGRQRRPFAASRCRCERSTGSVKGTTWPRKRSRGMARTPKANRLLGTLPA
ncbi:MAG: hypothetical protein HZA88_24205 [Verrucomicrobia bacterium]|nr:hypothetical protein [Verrucomicrobiota bacterium]